MSHLHHHLHVDGLLQVCKIPFADLWKARGICEKDDPVLGKWNRERQNSFIGIADKIRHSSTHNNTKDKQYVLAFFLAATDTVDGKSSTLASVFWQYRYSSMPNEQAYDTCKEGTVDMLSLEDRSYKMPPLVFPSYPSLKSEG